MSANSRFVLPFQTVIDAVGVPLPGALLNFYLTSSDTRSNTYSNAGLTVANTNPVEANAAGRFGNIFLDPSVTYKVVLTDADGVEQWTADPVNGAIGVAANYAALRANGSPSVMVFVEGRLTEQDGGQGWFSYDPNDTTTVDNGGTILVNGSKRWKRLYNGPVFPEWWGAGPSPIDSTAAINTAITLGGQVYLQAIQYDYTALIVQNPVRLTGAVDSQNAARALLNCTSAGSGDKIVIGGIGSELDGVRIEHLTMSAPSATGGAIVSYDWTSNCAIDDVEMINLAATQYGVLGIQMNTMRFSNMRVIQPTDAGFRFYGTDARRTDVVDFYGIVVSGDALTTKTHTPDAIQLDGFVNTISGHSLKFVTPGRGLYCVNTVGATQRAEFVMMYDMEVDFPLNEAVRIEWHDSCYFSDAYLHGSQLTSNVVIVNRASPTNTNISFIGGNSTGAFASGFDLDGRYTRILGMIIAGNSQEGSALHPGVKLGANSLATVVQGCQIGSQVGLVSATQNYGVEIVDGAQQYTVTNNDLTGNVTGPLLDHSSVFPTNSACATAPNIGSIGDQSFLVNAPSSGDTLTFDRNQTIAVNGSGTLVTLTVQLAAKPVHGQEARFFSLRDVTTLTVSPGAGQTIDSSVSLTALTAPAGFTLKYDSPAAKWFQVY